MPADDLFARIALDPFRTGIPIDDVTLRIEHVDRVVGDAFHEQPEAPFGLFELRQARREFPGTFLGPLFQRLVELCSALSASLLAATSRWLVW